MNIGRIHDFYYILSNFFPNVLSVLIIEYITAIHEIKHLQTLTMSYARMSFYTTRIISGGKIWTYNSNTKKLDYQNIMSTTPKMDNMLNNIFVHNTHMTEIFVFDSNGIHVFDEKCNKKKIICIECQKTDYCNIALLNNNIYIFDKFTDPKIIDIYDITGKFVNKITLDEYIECIKIIDDCLYILLNIGEIIQLMSNGEFIYIRNVNKINYFCVIDNQLYVIYKGQNNVYIIDYQGKSVVFIDVVKPYKIYFDDGILYIYSCHVHFYGDEIIMYEIKKNNIMNMLKKID